MKNIISYVEEYGDSDFEDIDFNEVDSLILCQMSYLKYDLFMNNIEGDKQIISLKDIYNSDHYEDFFRDYWYYDDNKELVKRLVESKRFGGMRLAFFESVYNEEKDAQFAAITYILEDKSVYIAYRGTDATLLGWKEDMKLAFSKPIRAQELATAYLNEVADRFGGSFRIGGHSKGGNLAVYAAMMCRGDIRDRIIAIYNNDGPGFRPEIINSDNMAMIKDRIHKFIPRESVVGILLDAANDYEIIDSYSIGTLQHNTYTWKIDKTGLVRGEDMSLLKKVQDMAINQWIYTLSESEINIFIDVCFELFTASDAKDLFDIIEAPNKAIESAYEAFKELDPSDKGTVYRILLRLLDISSYAAKGSINGNIEKAKKEIKRLYKDKKDARLRPKRN